MITNLSYLPSARPEQNPALVYLSRLMPRSRQTMEGSLRKLAGMAALFTPPIHRWQDLRYFHTQAIRAQFIADGMNPATANRHLAALRGVLLECWNLELMEAKDYEKARNISSIKGQALLRGRTLNADELKMLLCNPRSAGEKSIIRDRALLSALFGCGLRREELACLDMGDHCDGAITIRHGKGNKSRIVYAPPKTIKYLMAWLITRGDAPGPLFLPIDRHGRIGTARLSGTAVYNIYVKRCKEAALAHTSPHDARRTCASNMLDLGIDLGTVSKVLGHESITTTMKYDLRGEQAKKEAAERMEIP